jgi:hypothetical protein
VKRIYPIFNAVVAIAAGVIVLLGYFVTNIPALVEFRIIILQVAVLLAGVAVLIGMGNLVSVHLQKMRQQKPGAVYSLVLLVFFLMTFVVTLASNFSPNLKQFQNTLLNGIMVPTEISLMAILSVTLLYASVRMLRWRIDLKTILFLATAFLLLLGTGPLPFIGEFPFIAGLIHVLATGGARGILLGVALGTLTTGLRILFAADRPYGGK